MIDGGRILSCPMGDNDAGAETVGQYLIELLATLWRESDGFSGKRPFGNSDWQFQVYLALCRGGLLAGTLDEGGYLDDCDAVAADRLIFAAIGSLDWAKQ